MNPIMVNGQDLKKKGEKLSSPNPLLQEALINVGERLPLYKDARGKKKKEEKNKFP